MTEVKICGITTPDALDCAVKEGAHYLGFVFHPGSPRAIDPEKARILTNKTPSNLVNVGLFVNPSLTDIETVLAAADLDMIQLHGDETLQQIQAIRGQCGLPVIKAIRVAEKADLAPVLSFEKVCDLLLFDAKVPGTAGGTGQRFDWTLLKDLRLFKPWMLAGGLTAENVGDALSTLNPPVVDVSSGVEDAPGIKNPDKIRQFIEAVKKKN
ncbi:MAG: phosphoribosylanthranilate isomerase [Rhodospirillales bacterium]|nr:phosphoribosylanthranilate isomerase [Rhodospirillales bacterium]MCB9996091.1 phosphoribosylanthranilate isomerase [Rhodospirillales bacterium]